MINTGFHIKKQSIWRGDRGKYRYYRSVYWVQRRVDFLGIPLYNRNMKGFSSIQDALLYIESLK